MDRSIIYIYGALMGRRLDPHSSNTVAEIVYIKQTHKPIGPAANAFVLVEIVYPEPRARYISWINYFDLEYASDRETGAWVLVEPFEDYQKEVIWYPYGWPGARTVPTIGDAILEEIGYDVTPN